jgi:hypothetical protein
MQHSISHGKNGNYLFQWWYFSNKANYFLCSLPDMLISRSHRSVHVFILSFFIESTFKFYICNWPSVGHVYALEFGMDDLIPEGHGHSSLVPKGISAIHLILNWRNKLNWWSYVVCSFVLLMPFQVMWYLLTRVRLRKSRTVQIGGWRNPTACL